MPKSSRAKYATGISSSKDAQLEQFVAPSDLPKYLAHVPDTNAFVAGMKPMLQPRPTIRVLH